MTLEEKIGNLDTGASAIPSLGLNGYNWWSEASTGVASGRNTQTTKFAFPITTVPARGRLSGLSGSTVNQFSAAGLYARSR
jgi:hypothetical protein